MQNHLRARSSRSAPRLRFPWDCACPTLPIILYTVHFFPAMVDEAKKVGIREVVSKSETAGRLMDVIETLLKEKPSDRASVPSVLPQPELSDAEIRDDEQKPPEAN